MVVRTNKGNILKRLNFDRETLIRFLIVSLGSQVIYSLISIRSVLYNPYRETLGLTNAQLGALFSITGLVATFAYIPGGWILDRFSCRKVLSINMFLTGLCGFVMTWGPPYWGLVAIFALFGLITDGFYWGGVLKEIRGIASDKAQGTAFGSLELIRGLTEFAVNSFAILIFTICGQMMFGIRITLGINSALIVGMAAITWMFLPEEHLLAEKMDDKNAKNKLALKGLLRVLVMPEVWLVGLEASGIYVVYIGLQYFVPFLQEVFKMPVALVAVFGILNTSGTRMVASPLAGVIGDRKFGSSTKFMRALLALEMVLLAVILLIPKQSSFMLPSIIVLILISIACFMLRGIYIAPIGELGLPKEICGSAMSVASLIGYSPVFWAYGLFGAMIDSKGAQGYPDIFAIMLGCALLGLLTCSFLCRMIDRGRRALLPSTEGEK